MNNAIHATEKGILISDVTITIPILTVTARYKNL